jgi:biotin synthase
MLCCGANVVMPNITPVDYKVNYEIYPNKACLYDEASTCKGCLYGRIRSINRTVSKDYGDRKFSKKVI